MRKTPFMLPLFAAAVLAAGGCGSKTTLHLVEHADTDVVTDLGATGDSVGDVLTFANKVFDASNQNQVGTDSGYCVRTVVGQNWECAWTVFLADGQISVEGPFFDTRDSRLAIIGGTGAYNNASGELALHSRDAMGTEYDFTYEVIR